MSNIVYVPSGNLMLSTMQTLVCPVNTVGVMGKGLAKTMAAAYPALLPRYRVDCATQRLSTHTGALYTFDQKNILCLATKEHWRNPSLISYIEQGLLWLVEHWRELGITSIAFPKLGCGCGELAWEEVHPVMLHYLSNLDIPIEIYA